MHIISGLDYIFFLICAGSQGYLIPIGILFYVKTKTIETKIFLFSSVVILLNSLFVLTFLPVFERPRKINVNDLVRGYFDSWADIRYFYGILGICVLLYAVSLGIYWYKKSKLPPDGDTAKTR